MLKTFYIFDESGAFTHAYEAQENPKRPGNFIAPSNSTDVAPDFVMGTWPVWLDSNWINVPDHRGAVWNVNTKEMVDYTQLNDLPDYLTIQPPPSNLHVWSGSQWVYDLNAVKAHQSAVLKISVAAAISGGILLNVLGTEHQYPTSATDQVNLNGLVTESLLPGAGDEYKFWCADASGAWARRPHTKLEIQQLGKAVVNHVKSQQQRYEILLDTINACVTADDVFSVVW